MPHEGRFQVSWLVSCISCLILSPFLSFHNFYFHGQIIYTSIWVYAYLEGIQLATRNVQNGENYVMGHMRSYFRKARAFINIKWSAFISVFLKRKKVDGQHTHRLHRLSFLVGVAWKEWERFSFDSNIFKTAWEKVNLTWNNSHKSPWPSAYIYLPISITCKGLSFTFSPSYNVNQNRQTGHHWWDLWPWCQVDLIRYQCVLSPPQNEQERVIYMAVALREDINLSVMKYGHLVTGNLGGVHAQRTFNCDCLSNTRQGSVSAVPSP